MKNAYDNIVIVGAGGIGSFLGPVLTKLQCFDMDGGSVTIIDPDVVEDGNLSRVYGTADIDRNKAELLSEICEDSVPSGTTEVSHIPEVLSPDTLERYHRSWYRDGVVIFGCVDNNRSRVYMEELISGLNSGILISAGNAEFDGQSHLYVRKDGEDVTPPPSAWIPSLRDTEDPYNIFPGDEDCSKEYESKPQLILANMYAANSALAQFYYGCVLNEPHSETPNDMQFNIEQGGGCRPWLRKVAKVTV